jgi:hypothetical protein
MPEYGKRDWMKCDGWQLTQLAHLTANGKVNVFTGAGIISSKQQMATRVTIIP